MESNRAKWIGVGFLILLGLVYLFNLYQERERSLWDFKTYYFAAEALRAGENPYQVETLSKLAGEEISLPFLYPPFTLFFFLPFTIFSYGTAFSIYFTLKVLTVVLLFWIWRVFLERDFDWFFLPFALVAFNSAVPLDIASGNISSFEQILLWLGFLFHLRGRLFEFCFLVLLASLFKMTPLFFLVLLFFAKDRKKYRFLAGTLAAFVAVHVLARLLYPTLMDSFSLSVDRTLGDHESRGLWNPSTFAFIRDVWFQLAAHGGGEMGMRGPFFVFALVGILFSWITFRSLLSSKGDGEGSRDRICILSLLYLLLIPRLQVYSYLLALPPTYYLLRKRSDAKVYPLSLFFLMSLSAKDVFFPGMKEFYEFFWDYSPLVVVAFLWGYEMKEFYSRGDLKAEWIDRNATGPKTFQ